jgi:hypothetical protein
MNHRLLPFAALLGFAACGDSTEIDPGLYEVETQILQVRAEGLPADVAQAMRANKQTRRNCITAEAAANPEASFLSPDAVRNCPTRQLSFDSGRISGSMTCTGLPGQPNARGEVRMSGTYEERSYEYTAQMELSAQLPGSTKATPITMEVRTRGTRIGECQDEKGGNASAGGNRQ